MLQINYSGFRVVINNILLYPLHDKKIIFAHFSSAVCFNLNRWLIKKMTIRRHIVIKRYINGIFTNRTKQEVKMKWVTRPFG